jgi:hypothetical protein
MLLYFAILSLFHSGERSAKFSLKQYSKKVGASGNPRVLVNPPLLGSLSRRTN